MKWLKRFESRHPLLNMHTYCRAFNNDSIGCENKNALITSEKGKVVFYRLKEENEKLREMWKQKYLNKGYMEERFKWINQTLENAENFVNKIKNLQVEKLTNEKLYELYKDYVNIFLRIFQGYNLSQPEVPAVCEEELKNLISIKSDNLAEVFSIITTPSKMSFIKQEELDWLKLLLEIKEYGLIPEIRDKIKLHSDKYGWISTQENLPFLDVRHFISLVKEDNHNKETIRKNIDEIKNKPKQIKNKRKNILNKLKNEKIKQHSKTLRKAGHLRLLLRLAWTKTSYFSRNLFTEIGNRIRLTYEETRYCFPEEIKDALINNKALGENNINERMEKYLMILNDGELEFYTTEKAEEIKNREIVKEEIKTNEVKGSCANPGFVRGKVKIIHSHVDDQLKEVKKMQQGEILVAGNTKPQLIVACRKASAIVTDEGGITCHAAIVSREFGIPCIVGTSIATKVFKDGDIIEVDAAKGIARKIR